MTLEEFLYRRLADDAAVALLVGLGGSPAEAKIFPLVAPQKSGAPPYIVHQRVATLPVSDLAITAAFTTRIQFTCRARTFDEANALADAARAAIDGADQIVGGWGRITVSFMSSIDLYDDQPKSFARVVEFSAIHPS